MERIQAINYDRIAWCCADLGMTLDDAASVLGMSPLRWTESVEQKKGLSFSQLRKLADYFGRGVLFFLEADSVVSEQVHTPQFRTLAQQKPDLTPRLKKLIERVERQRAIYLSLREDLGDEVTSKFEPPQLPINDIPTAAAIARKWLKLKNHNDFDTLREAVEAKGVLVFRTNGYNGAWQIAKDSSVWGFALHHETSPVIVVRKLAFPAPQAFTLMHELGHLLLHKASWIDEEQDLYSNHGAEREANQFAGLVLVPEEFLNAIDDKTQPTSVTELDDWLRPHTRLWGVSAEVVLRRLLDVGRLTQSRYSEYRAWRKKSPNAIEDLGGNRQYRHREPKHIFGDRYVRTVLDSLSAQHITLSKASGYLDSLKLTDMHELERHYAHA